MTLGIEGALEKDDVGHRRFQPTLVNLRMTLLASLRADIVCRSRSLRLPNLLLLRSGPKTANIKNQFPAVVIVRLMWIAPGRHPGQFHAVLNNVVNFPIRKVLCCRGAKVWYAGIE